MWYHISLCVALSRSLLRLCLCVCVCVCACICAVSANVYICVYVYTCIYVLNVGTLVRHFPLFSRFDVYVYVLLAHMCMYVLFPT